MVKILLDQQTGEASEEEIKEFRKMLKNIEKQGID
jgi:pullulanase/glycogen debranching enzyme